MLLGAWVVPTTSSEHGRADMTREYHRIHLTGSFDDSARAKKVLQHYFRPLSGKNTGYTGGLWDSLIPAEPGQPHPMSSQLTIWSRALCFRKRS